MTFARVKQFSSAGREFVLYQGDSWVLFEEHDDESEGIGDIHQTDVGLVAMAWWSPGTEIHTATLREAVDELVAIEPPEDFWLSIASRAPAEAAESAVDWRVSCDP